MQPQQPQTLTPRSSMSNNSSMRTNRTSHNGGLFAAPSCGLVVLLLLLIHDYASSSPFDAASSSSVGSNDIISITPRRPTLQRQRRRVQTNTAVGNPDGDVDAFFAGTLQSMTGLESCLFCPNDAASGMACLGLQDPDGNTGVSPEACLPCATGQTYWPCNLVDTCYCRTPTGEIVLPDDLINEDTNEVGIGSAVNIEVAPTTASREILSDITRAKKGGGGAQTCWNSSNVFFVWGYFLSRNLSPFPRSVVKASW
jgi:hypothetical protein